MIRLLLLLTCLFCAQLACAQAKEDFKIPQSLITQVKNGNAEIAYFIATQLFSGSEKFNPDYDQALEWLEKSATMGYAHAMEKLANELDMQAKEKEALFWFQKAAELGIGEVLDSIALYHYLGKAGLQADCQAAYEWFEKAQIKGVKSAYNNHAWFLATAKEKKCRNPEKALKIISELWSMYAEHEIIPWFMWDTKTAVLASIADFNTAIRLQEWIITEMLKDELEVTEYQKHLNSYKLRQPWIEIDPELP